MDPHNILLIDVVDVQHLHGADQRLDGGDDVLKHQAGEALPVGLAVPAAVDDSHLFDESALPALPRPWVNETRETEALESGGG